MIARLERIVGAPVELEQLTHRPGRRRTLRATGPVRTAIVKLYASDRAETVAGRIAAIDAVPPGVTVPRVLLSDPVLHMVVMSELKGEPLTAPLLAGDSAACRCAGAAIGSWHRSWRGRVPKPLRPHRVERELAILHRYAEVAPEHIGAAVRGAADDLAQPWTCSTVVHRDLHAEQVLMGERVGLIDLDYVAAGPPELDVGSLLAHADLLSLRSGRDLGEMSNELVLGYEGFGENLDRPLLDRCRRLARLRLACVHDEPRLTHRPNHRADPVQVPG